MRIVGISLEAIKKLLILFPEYEKIFLKQADEYASASLCHSLYFEWFYSAFSHNDFFSCNKSTVILKCQNP